ncbi:unnamed protein product [Ixodes hexagonus]
MADVTQSPHHLHRKLGSDRRGEDLGRRDGERELSDSRRQRTAVPGTERVLRLEYMDGILVPAMSFKHDILTDALLYQARPGDIFLATYPKTGATWTQYILWTLLNLENEKALPSFGDIMTSLAPFLELVGREAVERLPEPRIIKHHLPFSRSPYHPKAKYVVIVRNPFDCAVSFYHHCLGDRFNMGMRADTTFDEFFEDFMDGHVPFGEYFEHVLSWYAHRKDPNVFFFYYEKLKEDQAQWILKIAEFIDESLANRLRKDEVLLKDVVRRTSFENMKATVKIAGDVHKKEHVQEPEDSGSFTPLKNFFRKGRVGDWRSYFKYDQEQRLRRVYERRMRGTVMWDVWKEYLGYDNTETIQ